MKLKKILVIAFLFLLGLSFSKQSLVVKRPDEFQGKNGSLKDVSFSFKPVGAYIECEMSLSFTAGEYTELYGNSGDDLEVIYNFELPEKAIITQSWLWFNGEILKAEIRDLRSAITEFDGVVNRKEDPSLLRSRGQNDYELNVYPLRAEENAFRKVKITYLLPVEWNSSKVSTDLSLDLLTSYHDIENIEVKLYEYAEWQNPLLNLNSSLNYIPETDGNGSYLKTEIEKAELGSTIQISYDNPATDGIYINRYREGVDWGYYTLAVIPSLALNDVVSRDVMVVLDYDENNTELSKLEFINQVKSGLTNSLNSSDRFNLILSGKPNSNLFSSWKEASNDNLSNAINGILLSDLDNGDLLQSLKHASSFTNGSNSNAANILCYSNTSENNSTNKVNSFTNSLFPFITSEINFIDFDLFKQGPFFFFGGQPYKGNSLLYERISEFSGGKWLELKSSSATIPVSTTEIISSLDNLIDKNISFQTDQRSFTKYTFDEFDLGNNNTLYYDKAIQRVGKFKGEDTIFVIITENESNSSPQVTVKATKNTISDNPEDSLTKKIWAGEKIRRLSIDLDENDNTTKGRIFTLSEAEQILSPITAFLAIEPDNNDTTLCIEDCRVNDVTFTHNFATNSNSLTLSPNPANEKILIEINDSNFKPEKLLIYDSQGVLIKEVQIKNWAESYELLLTDLASGIYYVKLADKMETRIASFTKF